MLSGYGQEENVPLKGFDELELRFCLPFGWSCNANSAGSQHGNSHFNSEELERSQCFDAPLCGLLWNYLQCGFFVGSEACVLLLTVVTLLMFT